MDSSPLYSRRGVTADNRYEDEAIKCVHTLDGSSTVHVYSGSEWKGVCE